MIFIIIQRILWHHTLVLIKPMLIPSWFYRLIPNNWLEESEFVVVIARCLCLYCSCCCYICMLLLHGLFQWSTDRQCPSRRHSRRSLQTYQLFRQIGRSRCSTIPIEVFPFSLFLSYLFIFQKTSFRSVISVAYRSSSRLPPGILLWRHAHQKRLWTSNCWGNFLFSCNIFHYFVFVAAKTDLWRNFGENRILAGMISYHRHSLLKFPWNTSNPSLILVNEHVNLQFSMNTIRENKEITVTDYKNYKTMSY